MAACTANIDQKREIKVRLELAGKSDKYSQANDEVVEVRR